MKVIKDKYHYEIQLNTNSDRRVLLTLKDDKYINYIGKGINVIYIYSFVDLSISYPNKEGKILYIGEAFKNANPTGMRFYQHILSKLDEGKNVNVNYSLYKYYWNGFKMAVEIFDIGDVSKEKKRRNRKRINRITYENIWSSSCGTRCEWIVSK